MAKVCSRCRAPLIYAIAPNGGRIPLDEAPDATGTSRYAVRFRDGRWYARTLAAGKKPGRGERLHSLHRKTCTARAEGSTLPGGGVRIGGPPPVSALT